MGETAKGIIFDKHRGTVIKGDAVIEGSAIVEGNKTVKDGVIMCHHQTGRNYQRHHL